MLQYVLQLRSHPPPLSHCGNETVGKAVPSLLRVYTKYIISETHIHTTLNEFRFEQSRMMINTQPSQQIGPVSERDIVSTVPGMTEEFKDKVHSLLGVRCVFPERAICTVGEEFTARCMLENLPGRKPPSYKDTIEDIIIRLKAISLTPSTEANGTSNLKVGGDILALPLPLSF
jgi:hypothetical protein